jgi:hypothetical protein
MHCIVYCGSDGYYEQTFAGTRPMHPPAESSHRCHQLYPSGPDSASARSCARSNSCLTSPRNLAKSLTSPTP